MTEEGGYEIPAEIECNIETVEPGSQEIEMDTKPPILKCVICYSGFCHVSERFREELEPKLTISKFCRLLNYERTKVAFGDRLESTPIKLCPPCVANMTEVESLVHQIKDLQEVLDHLKKTINDHIVTSEGTKNTGGDKDVRTEDFDSLNLWQQVGLIRKNILRGMCSMCACNIILTFQFFCYKNYEVTD